MRPSLGQMLSRLFSGTSLAGNDLPARLRSTTLGLLGLVAAAGLGLVALIFQQSWPGVFSGPLPESPPRFERNDPIALIQPEAPLGRARPARQPRSRPVPTQARTPLPDVESQLAASRQVEVSPPAPAPAPAPDPPAPPADPKSQSSPPPVSSTTTAPAIPPPGEDSGSAPIAAGAEDDDDPPGRSGKSHRHSSHDSGRPSWAGHGGNDHGRDDDDDDDHDYDDRDYDDDDYGDDDDDRGKRDWDDD